MMCDAFSQVLWGVGERESVRERQPLKTVKSSIFKGKVRVRSGSKYLMVDSQDKTDHLLSVVMQSK